MKIKVYHPIDWLKLAHAAIVAAWMLFVGLLLTLPLPIPPEQTEVKFTWNDKFIHFLLLGFLARLIAGWLARYSRWSKRAIIAFSIGATIIFSGLLELIQDYLPTRSDSGWDLIAGFLGAAMFLWVWAVWQEIRPKRKLKPTLLLHVCCGPCGSEISGELTKNFDVTLFFFNPNIDTKEEYDKRFKQVKKVAKHWQLPAIVAEYDRKSWRRAIKGLEKEPERGARCPICYSVRLNETAKFAAKNDFAYFSTTLSISPQKLTEAVLAAGRQAAKKYQVKFWDKDFKKQDGYKKAIVKAKSLKLYRQDYCGCEFSKSGRGVDNLKKGLTKNDELIEKMI